MSDKQPAIGSIGWVDLTVENAEQLRDFYREVAGWQPAPVSMGEYNDFNMCEPATGTPVAGVCHARGGNAGLPPLWLIYINVEDLDRSIERCVALGGAVIVGSKCMGEQGRVCVVRDPAGAAVALFEPPKSS
jgi:hypothetical protein